MNKSTVNCRSCGHAGLHRILSLGQTPLANALLRADQVGQSEPKFPLDLAVCLRCSLAQLEYVVPPAELFSDYVYFSSFSETMLRHVRNLSQRLIEERKLGSHSLVLEAASNDGYLLQYYRQAGVPVLGIEPASNIVEVARNKNSITTLNEFFSTDLAVRLRGQGQLADVFHAHNVLAHVPDLNGFVNGIRTILKDDGLALIEVPYVKDMLDHCEFDTIYHEHLCYFSLTALDRLFRRHSLLIQHVERIPIHGGSLRVFAVPALPDRAPAASVRDLLAEEQAWGVDKVSGYGDFAAKVQKLKSSLGKLLANLKLEGLKLAGYGASAKGATLLNYCGIGGETLDYIVDRSTYKQGRFTPGSQLPIYAPEKLLEDRPDYVLLLTWNFAAEIIEQQAECRRRGTRFILPVPEPAIL